MLPPSIEKIKYILNKLLPIKSLNIKVFKPKSRLLFRPDFVTFIYLGFSLLLIIFSVIYTALYFGQMPTQIPLWYSLIWGVYRLSIKQYIFLIPLFSFLMYLVSVYFCLVFLRNNIKEVARFIATITFVCVFFLSLSTVFIVNSTVSQVYVFGDYFWRFFIPFIVAFCISFVTARFVIRNAARLKIIEYPTIRNEPQKVLQNPTPRGGAIAFFIGFAVTSLIFLNTSQKVWGLVIGTLITTITGYLDDRYKLNYLPRLLVLLPLSFVVVILSGFVTFYLPNPFGEVIKLDSLRVFINVLGSERSIVVYGAIFSFLWFMWMSNMMSWNNGVDGQFVAISSVAVLSIAVLSFRFGLVSYEQQLSAQISFIALGAILGLFWFTFPPQKIIWGFGATGVGLIIAALSILSGTRVASATFVLLIPAIDTIYVILNRLKNKKSPFLGDANHLHHKLLQLGFSRRKIALIYWAVSLLFFGISIFSSGKTSLLLYLTMLGLALYFIILIRYYAQKALISKTI